MTLACLLVIFMFCVLLSVGHGFGVGKHFATIPAEHKVEALRWGAILNAVTPWMCTLPKFAIVMTLNRILDFNKRTAILFWGLALTSQATVVVLTFWTFLQCAPIAYQWDRTIDGGSCANPQVYLHLIYFVFAYSTALDVFFALYPVPHVMRLNMPLKTRIGVSLSLSLGLVGFAISIYKFTIFPELGALVATDPSCKQHPVRSCRLYALVLIKNGRSVDIHLYDACRRGRLSHHRQLSHHSPAALPQRQSSRQRYYLSQQKLHS